MARSILAASIAAALAFTTWSTAAVAQSQTSQDTSTQSGDDAQAKDSSKDKKDEAKTVGAVIVTGSLIPQTEVETASPVISVTSEDLDKKGFRDAYDALKSQSVSTGTVFSGGELAGTGTFTPGANSISLFGLDPGFTLVLLNGHPLADYPLPYNGTQNFVDISSIPTNLIERIDILSGGQSSLYGSSAVAGVVNIILKDRIEGYELTTRLGGYSQGGGNNQRVTFSGGKRWGDLDLAFGLQFDRQAAVWGFDRSWMDATLDSPTGTGVASRVFLNTSAFTGYIDPGESACAAGSGLFGGTVEYTERPGFGMFCGSYYQPGYSTLLNKSSGANGYANLVYHLSGSTEAYAEVLYSFSKPVYSSGSQFWSYNSPALNNSANAFNGYFYDVDTDDIVLWQRIIAPEEMGGLFANAGTIYTRQYNVNLGVRGQLGNSDWDYDVYYNRSSVSTDSSQLWPLNQPFTDYYLGPNLGADPYGYGFDAFSPNPDHLYTPLTPQQFASFSDYIASKSLSWTQNLTATFTNTDLFELPGGSAGFAGVVTVGNQAFNNPVDPRVIAGEFAGITGTSGDGTRDRYAVGGELRLPLAKPLVADLSARWDDYKTGNRNDRKLTYKLGLEYRPVQTLLLRGSYATSFRAPAMEYVYQKDSGFYQGGINDYFLCRLTDQPIDSCDQAGQYIFARNYGSPNLKNETATSWGFGVVWAPTRNFNVKVDYQHIEIKNEITTQSVNSLLLTESNCQFGTSEGGEVFDPTSPTCLDAFSRVHRFPFDDPFVLAAGTIKYVEVSPVNIASERLDGLQASLDYHWDTSWMGGFDLGLSYYNELNHEYQRKPGDPRIDLLANYNSYEFKTRGSASLTWTYQEWATTLYGSRVGKSVNGGGTGLLPAYTTYNGSVRYNLSEDSYLQLTANNLTDRKPPVDATFGYPYYNAYNFSALGRSWFIELGIKFGSGQ